MTIRCDSRAEDRIMPIPFRDTDDVEELGSAGYLKIHATPDGGRYHGALFIVNARGEPLEFSYNDVEVPNSFLWRQEDVFRNAVRKLAVSLLEVCPRTPRFLLCLADEVHHDLFCRDIQMGIPVCRLAPDLEAASHSSTETRVLFQMPEPWHAFWFPARPDEKSVEHQLFARLLDRHLLLEPFDRALQGLNVVYPDRVQAGPAP